MIKFTSRMSDGLFVFLLAVFAVMIYAGFISLVDWLILRGIL